MSIDALRSVLILLGGRETPIEPFVGTAPAVFGGWI
jgi:hypothetical protein